MLKFLYIIIYSPLNKKTDTTNDFRPQLVKINFLSFLMFIFVKNSASAVFYERDIISFSIIDAQRQMGVYMGREPGNIKPTFNWEISYLND